MRRNVLKLQDSRYNERLRFRKRLIFAQFLIYNAAHRCIVVGPFSGRKVSGKNVVALRPLMVMADRYFA